MNYIHSCGASVNNFLNRHVAMPSSEAVDLAIEAGCIGMSSVTLLNFLKVNSILSYLLLGAGALSVVNLALKVALFIRDRNMPLGNQQILFLIPQGGLLHRPIVASLPSLGG